MIGHETVVVLDYGSQYTQLIARRVRAQRVFCEILPFDAPVAEIRRRRPSALILSGGPASVTAEEAPDLSPDVLELGVPIFGICYGLQVLTRTLGGRVETSSNHEYGRARVRHTPGRADEPLLAGLESSDTDGIEVWMSHGDHVVDPAPGFDIIARSDDGVIAAVGNPSRLIWGVQFHPEVAHTPRGEQLIRNFLFDIAGLEGDWTAALFVEEAIARIRDQVGSGRVVCGLSGGVDSSVAAMLIHAAIGDRLTCVFVDNGLLRKNEAEQVMSVFGERFNFDLRHVDASGAFLSALAGVADPEQKRKIIGRVFVEVFERVAATIEGVEFLGQGTLYPDVIESVCVRGPSAVIKSHHNVGGLPAHMHLKTCEPLRELFKDEVRQAGIELGLDEALVWRHPFPGPGLAIRILDSVTPESLRVLREADAIVREEIDTSGLFREIWQGFCVLLPVKTVGVMGDERTYENVVAIRCVSSVDGMTADWFPMPYAVLGRMSTRIINEVRGVNRVVYDVSSKPPATIEWE